MVDLPEPVQPHLPAEPADPQDLRASNADRERIAAVLREAAAEGRIDLDELEQRLGSVYAAKTYRELTPLIGDLPAGAAVPLTAESAPDIRQAPGGTLKVPSTRWLIAVLSGFDRRGRWLVHRALTCIAFWGGGRLDLREAYLVDGEVRIRAFALMGGFEIIVPEHANLYVTGWGIMGGFDQGAAGAGVPGGPTIVVSGFSIWGGVSVERRSLKKSHKQVELGKKSLDDH